MVDVDGMVCGLVEPIEDSDGATGLGCSREYSQRKGFLVNYLRTAESEHQTAWGNLGDRGRVEPLVSPQSIAKRSTVLSECRRIDNHKVVFILWYVPEEIHGISTDVLMESGIKASQSHIPGDHLHCLLRTVYRIYMHCPVIKGIDGKATRVAEKVQDISPLRVPSYEIPVLPLVQEEAGLLAFSPVDQELVAVLQDHLLVIGEAIGLIDVAIHEIQASLERSSPGTLVIDSFETVTENRFQSLADCSLRTEHTDGMGLHDTDAIIPIDYQSRKAIPLTMDEAADKYIKEYFDDAGALNVLKADVHPKVSEHIPEIIEFVQTLIDKGYAYEADVSGR